MAQQRTRKRVLPGFGMTMGFTLTYLSLMVLIPLAGLFIMSARMSWADFLHKAVLDPRVLAAYRLSFGSAFIAALINAVFGFIVAWVLVRYQFRGKRLVDALVDLPFALPTAVSGIALTTLYASTGWVGSLLAPLGISVAYTPAGIVVALILIGLPFAVRTVQPALEDMDMELEEAAASLGAGRLQVLARVILPAILPSILSGFTLAFARGIGEFGSVYFIAGNMPMKTEIAPLLIIIKLEQYDSLGAAAIGVVMLVVSFVMIFIINVLQFWSRRYQ
ncbi:MAG: sulfate ABC transporter permease subunit CysT [Deltaproteobacteria bacterium]|nr:sulfate ABC transporter permease subunit CysT [Deltaproteobacteria bacterium]